jgi:hypothetical protein
MIRILLCQYQARFGTWDHGEVGGWVVGYIFIISAVREDCFEIFLYMCVQE